MANVILTLLSGLGIVLAACEYAVASRDTLPEELPNSPHRPPLSHPQSPFVDNLSEEISLVVPKPTLVNERPYTPSPYDRLVIENDWPTYISYLTPTPLINPFEAYNQLKVELLKEIAKGLTIDLEIIKQREAVLKKQAEACPNSDSCKKVPDLELNDDLNEKAYWKPSGQHVRLSRLYPMIVSAKTAIEKLTIRQNMLFEYVSCSCASNSSCSTSVKPILDIMFINNPNITKEIVQNLFFPAKSAASNFFTSLFSHIPNFSQWLSTFNFNPLSSIFGNPVGFFPYNVFKPPVYNPGFWGYFKPTYSAGVYSSSSGPSSATVGSVSSETSSKPGGENYVINHPGGGTTHISSNSDGSGGSVSVVSTSGPSSKSREARQVIYGGPPQANPGYANQAALAGLGGGPIQANPGFANQAALASLGGARPGGPSHLYNPAAPFYSYGRENNGLGGVLYRSGAFKSEDLQLIPVAKKSASSSVQETA